MHERAEPFPSAHTGARSAEGISVSAFDDDTQVTRLGTHAADAGATASFGGQVRPSWNIGNNPNGGYLLALAAQALRQHTPAQPDPLSLTAHYLRPGLAGQPCRIDTQLLRCGRQLSTLRATLSQDGSTRLELLAAMGDLGSADAAPTALLTLPRPELPPPDECLARSAPAQGVGLPILERLDVRLHPDDARPGGTGRAECDHPIRWTADRV